MNPKTVIIRYDSKFPSTPSASSETPNNTNDPSPRVLINAANKPPKDICLFLYNEAITIVAPHPGIHPKNEPIIGCAHSGPILFGLLSYFFFN